MWVCIVNVGGKVVQHEDINLGILVSRCYISIGAEILTTKVPIIYSTQDFLDKWAFSSYLGLLLSYLVKILAYSIYFCAYFMK